MGGNGDREVWGGGGDQRPDGLEERREGRVKDQGVEDVDEGAGGCRKSGVRKARKGVRERKYPRKDVRVRREGCGVPDLAMPLSALEQ